MTIGVWEPAAKGNESKVDAQLLAALVATSARVDKTVGHKLLADSGLETSQWLMNLEAASWSVAEELTTEEIISLIRFFTLIESGVSGWDGGKKSPVIPLVKILKSREAFMPDLRKWIKANTDNRYLPNGAL